MADVASSLRSQPHLNDEERRRGEEDKATKLAASNDAQPEAFTGFDAGK